MSRYGKLTIKFWVVILAFGCGVLLFTNKTEKSTTPVEKAAVEKVETPQSEEPVSELLAVTDKLFGKGKTMPLSENPISQISFIEKDIYFKGEKTGSFCYGLLKDSIMAEITLENIEEFCRMILPTADFKSICIFPFLDDDIQKGFVFIKVDSFGIRGHFGIFDRQTGAISKSDWGFYYDILNKTIEKFEDES